MESQVVKEVLNEVVIKSGNLEECVFILNTLDAMYDNLYLRIDNAVRNRRKVKKDTYVFMKDLLNKRVDIYDRIIEFVEGSDDYELRRH